MKINKVSKAFSTYIGKDKDELDFEDEDMTLVLPIIVMKKGYRNSVEEVVVRVDVQLFNDQVSNVLAKTNHPLRSGGCPHLLDDEDRYYNQVGNKKATLPTTTGHQDMPIKMVTSTVEWKHYK